MVATIESFGSSIVAVGNFNPPIFSPDWLNRNGLIGDGDVEFAKKAASYVISPDVCRFETEWFTLQVVAQQFSLTSKGALTPLLKDLATGIFTIIDHTPVTALGLNFEANFKIPTLDELHKIGDVLVPKNIWHKIYPDDDHQSIGMANLTITVDPHKRDENFSNGNKKNISVRRSTATPNGVYFIFNDHYPFTKDETSKSTPANCLVRRIDDHWEELKSEAQNVFESIINLSLAA
jgi:hypothetical protein